MLIVNENLIVALSDGSVITGNKEQGSGSLCAVKKKLCLDFISSDILWNKIPNVVFFSGRTNAQQIQASRRWTVSENRPTGGGVQNISLNPTSSVFVFSL